MKEIEKKNIQFNWFQDTDEEWLSNIISFLKTQLEDLRTEISSTQETSSNRLNEEIWLLLNEVLGIDDENDLNLILARLENSEFEQLRILDQKVRENIEDQKKKIWKLLNDLRREIWKDNNLWITEENINILANRWRKNSNQKINTMIQEIGLWDWLLASIINYLKNKI